MKKGIIILLTVILLIVIIVLSKKTFNEEKGKITSLDYPTKLSKKRDTIEVTYIAWACACANWLPTHHLENPNYDTTENADDCIFLEADVGRLVIPDEFRNGCCGNKIRLIGNFYLDEGISRDYEKPTSQKPEKGKVFRYSEIEIIRPYTIWDFSEEKPATKIIKEGSKTTFD
jgi:hypothetical protein